LPRLVPWLALVVLLALATNRTAQAWLVSAPLLLITACEGMLQPLLGGFIPSGSLAILFLAFNSLAFGIAGLWLLAPYLGHRLRFVIFLEMLGVVGGISILAYLMRADWDSPEEHAGFLVFLGICVFTAVAALCLAAALSRRVYRPIALSIRLAMLLLALWTLILSPFFLVASVAGNGPEWSMFAQLISVFAALTLGVMLSFLALAFANRFYRERLKMLLRLSDAHPAPELPRPSRQPLSEATNKQPV
jgi:hypothetical protein